MYRARLFRELEMNVAAERSVALVEDEIECSVNSNFATIALRKHKRGEEPPYGAFIWELPKRALKKFPLLIQYTKGGELVEVSVLRADRRSKKARREGECNAKAANFADYADFNRRKKVSYRALEKRIPP